ncbi:helix-turn-helix domain-containing protein [Lactobacillus helsingborgensis]|uniref:helix-turn-helix domain-containing protein n=2 Tax=Lactobacillus helsingborgensis TaxID=1218494 RepID=UPI003977C196
MISCLMRLNQFLKKYGLTEKQDTVWMNQTNARKYLNVSKATFFRWEKAGKIPYSLIEGVKRYSKKELNQLMNEHRVCMR